jgi:hypothetical protein
MQCNIKLQLYPSHSLNFQVKRWND